MEKIVISLGSNLGDRIQNLKTAIENLKSYFEIEFIGEQIETDPVDYLNQPKFLNQLIVVKNTQFCPHGVLRILNSIERSLGRIRNITKGPRTVDLDIVKFSTRKYKDKLLTLDHPALYNREFLISLYNEIKSED